MRFEQAFYTWGENQISRYERGLGICAASNRQMMFLDNCMTVGGQLDAEPTDQQSEFLFYSYKFDSFVAVSINPAPTASDGRRNKLCHFFIPQKSNIHMEPNKYLLKYPFEKVAPSSADIDAIELEEEIFNYKDILMKYIKTQEKLEELLHKGYRCLFGEEKLLTILIDKEAHPEGNSEIARSLLWVLTALTLPEHRTSLTYGVNTDANTKSIKFLFTNHAEENAFTFSLDDFSALEETTPVFIKMLVKKAWSLVEDAEAWQKTRTYLEQLLEQNLTGKADWTKLQLLTWKQILEYGTETLEESEIAGSVSAILWHSEKSEWHRTFMRLFLKQGNAENYSEPLTGAVWQRIVLPWMMELETCQDGEQRNAVLQEQEQREVRSIAKNLLIRMDECNAQLFVSSLANMPGTYKDAILPQLFEQKKTRIYEEFQAVESFKALKVYFSNYQGVAKSNQFINELKEKAYAVYSDAERNERSGLSLFMEEKGIEDWKDYLKEKIYTVTDIDAYLAILEKEHSKIEVCMVPVYYEHLYELTEDEEACRDRIIACEDKLCKITKLGIDKDKQQQFGVRIQEWINEKNAAELKAYNLSELLNLDGKKIAGCKSIWIKRLKMRMAECESYEEGIFQLLCSRHKTIYTVLKIENSSEQKKTETSKLEEFEKAIWGYTERIEDIFYKYQKQMEFQMTVMNSRRHDSKVYYYSSVDFWHQLGDFSLDAYGMIYNCKHANEKLRIFSMDKSSYYYKASTNTSKGVYGGYCVWEGIKADKKLISTAFKPIIDYMDSESVKYYLRDLCDMISFAQSQNGIDNLCTIFEVLGKDVLKDSNTVYRLLVDKLRKFISADFAGFSQAVMNKRNMSGKYFEFIQMFLLIQNPEDMGIKKLIPCLGKVGIIKERCGNIEEYAAFRKRGGEIMNELGNSIAGGGNEAEKIKAEMEKAYQSFMDLYEEWEGLETKRTNEKRMYNKVLEVDKTNILGLQGNPTPYSKTEDFNRTQNIEKMKKSVDSNMKAANQSLKAYEGANGYEYEESNKAVSKSVDLKVRVADNPPEKEKVTDAAMYNKSIENTNKGKNNKYSQSPSNSDKKESGVRAIAGKNNYL